MKDNIFIQPYGELGIPIHSRELVLELLKLNDDVNILPIFNGNVSSLDKSIRSRIKKINYDGNAFIFWYPDTFEQLTGLFNKLIGYYIFEYTKIPRQYINTLNKTDIVATASEWGKGILLENGVTSRIEVIRGGVNSNKFPFLNRVHTDGPFVFGHVGKYERRKNTELLIESFLALYGNNNNFKLLLSVDNPHLKVSAKDIIESKYGKHENIEFVNELGNIKDFYSRIHCAVYPTNAEGIGLPIVESMSCGIPTIVSFNTGITEYATKDNSVLLTSLKEIPVFDELFFPRAGEFGHWMTPTKDELINAMDSIVKNYDKALIIGKNGSDYMHNFFSWKEPAIKLNTLLTGDRNV